MKGTNPPTMDARLHNNLAAVATGDGMSSFRTDSSLNDAMTTSDDGSNSVSTAQYDQEPSELALTEPFDMRSTRFTVGDLPISIDGDAVISTARSNQSSGSGVDLLVQPERMVQVPYDVLFFLDQSLGGPRRKYCVLASCERCCIGTRNRAWFHRRISLRVWLGTACGQAAAGGYLVHYFYTLFSSSLWTTIGWVGLAIWTVISALLLEGSVQMAKAVVNVLDSEQQQDPQSLLSVRLSRPFVDTFGPFLG